MNSWSLQTRGCGLLLFAWVCRAMVATLAWIVFLSGPGASANPIVDWNQLLREAIRFGNSAPTLASRNLAILNTAIYDAVNAIEPTAQPYRFQLPAPAGASAEAAAVGAAYSVCLLLYPEHRARFDDAYATYWSASDGSTAVADGLAYGRQIGNLAVDGRAADGSSTQVPYIPSEAPGQWRRTPPFYRPPLDPHWGLVDPFCLPAIEDFLPPGPPALASPEYAADLNLTKALGGKRSTERPSEQSTIATFWSDFSYTETPPGHWINIISGLVQTQGDSLVRTARLLALVSLAQADASIVVWRAKYLFNFWRPVTAINRAGEDGNPSTEADPTWESFLNTPPFPEYISGHSTFSAASAVVLRNFYGTDAMTFQAGSDALPNVIRTYHSFTACADEIGMSRIYGGIHFMSANRHGKACGAAIGQYVFDNFLLPNEVLPLVRVERLQAGLCQLRLHGHPGKTCVLESSLDLKTWQGQSTNQVAIGGATLPVINDSSGGYRFFRIVEK